VSFAFVTRRLKSLGWPFRPSNGNAALGSRGERLAVRYLRRHRHRIIARNHRNPAGEVDVITLDGDTLVFVEVKTRSSSQTQDPQETVGPRKWGRVERAARYFLMQHQPEDHAYRFDLVTVVWPPTGPPVIEHFVDAYQPCRP
jgi:putative endonuclease